MQWPAELPRSLLSWSAQPSGGRAVNLRGGCQCGKRGPLGAYNRGICVACRAMFLVGGHRSPQSSGLVAFGFACRHNGHSNEIIRQNKM